MICALGLQKTRPHNQENPHCPWSMEFHFPRPLQSSLHLRQAPRLLLHRYGPLNSTIARCTASDCTSEKRAAPLNSSAPASGPNCASIGRELVILSCSHRRSRALEMKNEDRLWVAAARRDPQSPLPDHLWKPAWFALAPTTVAVGPPAAMLLRTTPDHRAPRRS